MEKFKVTFEANDQQLKSLGTKHASDTYADIEATFVLGSRWTDMDSVSAVWWNDFTRIATVLDSDGKCIVPHEVLTRKGYVRVNLVGSVVENGELVTRLTSYSAEAVKVNEKIKLTGSETSEITPSQYEQFVANVKADADRAEAGSTASEQSAQNASESATASANSATSSAQSATASAQSAQNASDSAISAESAKDDAEDARDKILGMRATAETLEAGSDATASYSDGLLTLGIPRGDQGIQGIQGETGATPNLTIGTVETLAPTEDATATITGTAEEPILNLGIPKGEQGDVSLEQLEDYTIVQTDIDNEPYISRVVNGVGHTQYDTLVGGTVNWNQLASTSSISTPQTVKGVTFTKGANGSWNVMGTATGRVQIFLFDRFYTVSGHKYLVNISKNIAPLRLRENNGSIGQTAVSAVLACAEGKNTYFTFDSGVDIAGTTFNLSDVYVNIFDLTAMFGTQIADYIYNLEQTTVGAGVAFFKKLFPNDYYPYNSGELLSVQTSGHKVTDTNEQSVTYPLDADLELRGIPKLDASNNLYYDGDVYKSDGSVTRKYGVVDLGTLSWAIYASSIFTLFFAEIDGLVSRNGANGICTKYPLLIGDYNWQNLNDKQVLLYVGAGGPRIGVRDSAYTDVTAFKSAMNGVMLVYELATPTEETADPYTNPQVIYDGGMEEYLDAEIPVGHQTEYPMTLIDTIPSDNGTYTLKVTVANGKPTVSWVASNALTMSRPMTAELNETEETAETEETE